MTRVRQIPGIPGYDADTKCKASSSPEDTSCKSSAGGKLQEWNYVDFAYYLATVVEHARNSWGIHVTSLAPFNEPSGFHPENGPFWKYPKDQEGVNLNLTEQAVILRALRGKLNKMGLSDVKIAVSDENNLPDAIETFDFLVNQQGLRKFIDKVNVHSYANNNDKPGDRQELRTTIKTKKAWVSEYGNCEDWLESDAKDCYPGKLADTIMDDITLLKPSAWLYWQAVEWGESLPNKYSSWGLVNGAFGHESDKDSQERGKPGYINNKYYVFAQFTRFLRPGFEIVSSRQSRPTYYENSSIPINQSLASYDAAGKKLVLIWNSSSRSNKSESVTFDLTAASEIACDEASVTITSYKKDGGKQFEQTKTSVSGKKLAINAEPDTIYSIVVPGVTLMTTSQIGKSGDFTESSSENEQNELNDCSFELSDNHVSQPSPAPRHAAG